jgi:allene oxide cyclase-like protein
MIRRNAVTMVAAVTVGVLGFTLLPAFSAGGKTETFNLCDKNHPGYSKDLDLGEKGFSVGDMSFGADKLLDPQTNRKAGRDAGTFQIVRRLGKNDALFSIDATFFMPNGKFQVAGVARFGSFDEGMMLPVTGGTGHFANTTGEVFVKTAPCGGESGTRFKVMLQR